jgi:hypothetical protein
MTRDEGSIFLIEGLLVRFLVMAGRFPERSGLSRF